MDRRTESPVYCFGPFELDAGRRRLTKDGELIPLTNRQIDVLLVLGASAGRLVSKNDLADSAWHGIAVTDNSIDKAVSGLRQTLGRQPDGAPYLESQKRKGVRLTAPVLRARPEPPPVSLAALEEPYQSFVAGRAALETLDRQAIGRARVAFADALRIDPGLAVAHIGLATTCVMAFETTRADLAPDRAALDQADSHAREACQLTPSSGSAWSTLALVRGSSGEMRDAIAAAGRAITLEPNEWRHQLRLAFVSCGEERLRAAYRVLTLNPAAAVGHWLAATVFVSREAFDPAIEHLRTGAAIQDTQLKDQGRFAAVGLHWMLGLVLATRGSIDAAREELSREVAGENPGHIYGRECVANTWYTIGALALRESRLDEARAAFREALARVPGHPLALVGLGQVPRDGQARASWDLVAIATVRAAALAIEGRHDEAARIYLEALLASPSASGWLLPIEPLLNVSAHRVVWAQALAAVANRAS